MDSTTLVAFLLKTPAQVRRVELLGSWDNFQKPYALQRDRRGPGHWTGIHRFENIVFDGQRLDWSKPRNGALMQGGRYWYYYLLDDEEECCDETQPSTRSCPLLPGQEVNILEVPIEVVKPPERTRSASADAPSILPPSMTFDPADRYKKLQPRPKSKLPRHYSSCEGLQTVTPPISPEVEISNPPLQVSPSYVPYPSPRLPVGQSWKRTRHVDVFQTSQWSRPANRPISPQRPSVQEIGAFTSPNVGVIEAGTETASPVLQPFSPFRTSEEVDRPSTRYGTSSKPEPATKFTSLSNDASIAAGLGIGYRDDTSLEMEPSNPTLTHPPRISSLTRNHPPRTTSLNPPPFNFSRPILVEISRPPVQAMDDATRLEAYATTASEPSEAELQSPTFTAETVTSNGEESPLQLSDVYPSHDDYSSSAEANQADHDSAGLSHRPSGPETNTSAATASLSQTSSPRHSPDPTYAPSPDLNYAPQPTTTPLTFSALSTPRTATFQSDLYLSTLPLVAAEKSSTPRTQMQLRVLDAEVDVPSLPSPGIRRGGRGFADDVLGELSWMGEMIS